MMRPLLALLSMVFLVSCATAERGERLDVGPFEVSADAGALAEMTIAQARAEGKLALIVLGGNWCHDSKSLAKRLQSEDMAGLV
ncbi:MAG: thioredoxin family protein, partial [Parvularcula sp.]